MKYSLRKLFSNYFPHHRGRPGLVGGSVPKDGGTSTATAKKPSTSIYDEPAMRKHYQEVISDAYNANHVPSASDAYRGLEEFTEEWSIELDEATLTPAQKHTLKTRIKSAEREMKLLKRKFGGMIAE